MLNPVEILYSWFQENNELFVASCTKLEFKDTGRGSGRVLLESEFYIMDLCAWNHAICLDIQILEVESEESSFPHTGDCETIIEFKNHLNEFLVWFKSKVGKNA